VGFPRSGFRRPGPSCRYLRPRRIAVDMVSSGVMPFDEPGAPEVLKRVIAASRLQPTTDPKIVARAENVVVVIGTPVDEHLNPDPHVVPAARRRR